MVAATLMPATNIIVFVTGYRKKQGCNYSCVTISRETKRTVHLHKNKIVLNQPIMDLQIFLEYTRILSA